MKLGEMAISSKNWAYSIEVLKKAAELKPTDVPTRILLMDIYKAYQMPIQEIMAGREILALEPKNSLVLQRMAELYHDQDLPDDEVDVRSRLVEVKPRDYANMVVLAHLHWKIGQPWEEITVMRQLAREYPDKQEHLRRLAALYGDETVLDRFNQLKTLKLIPEYKRDPVTKKMRREAVGAYRKELKLFNPLKSILRVARDKSPEFHSTSNYEEALYMVHPIERERNRGVWVRHIHTNYKGVDQLRGTKKIDDVGWQLRQTTESRKGRNQLTLGVGATHIMVGGTLASATGEALSVTDFPFLEARPYGGTEPTALVEFQRELTNRLTLKSQLLHDLMEDLDAQVRMMSRTCSNTELAYQFLDSTRLSALHELWSISDGNTYHDARFTVERYVLGKSPVHDHKGHRTSFFKVPPTSFLAFKGQSDWMDHRKTSPFYQSYKSENQYELSLIAEVLVKPRLFLRGEALYAEGTQTLKWKKGYDLGVGYRDRDTGNEVLLQYQSMQDTVREDSQANVTLLGLSDVRHVQLTGKWHF
jgi:tetratricopeptide (TPR) repeat protein